MGYSGREYIKTKLSDEGLPEGIKFVNAYDVTLGYGGPEEGGWYFDIGVPLASIPVDNGAEAIAAITKLEARFEPEYRDERDKSSAAGGRNLSICLDEDTAAPYPERRPHYE